MYYIYQGLHEIFIALISTKIVKRIIKIMWKAKIFVVGMVVIFVTVYKFDDYCSFAVSDFVAKYSENADLCAKIHTLAGYTRKTTETKRFLADVKQV